MIFLVGTLPPPHNGQTIAFEFLARELKRRGVATRVFNLPAKENRSRFMGRVSQSIELIAVVAKFFVSALRTSATVYLTIAQSRRGFARDCIVIWLAAVSGNPVVCHLHGGNYDRFYEAEPKWLRWFIRQTLLRVKTLVILSNRLRTMFAFEPRLKSRIVAVANGIAPPAGGPESPNPKRIPSSGSVNLLYLSNMIASKGYLVVLEAIRILTHEFGVPIQAHFCGQFVWHEENSASSPAHCEREFYSRVEAYGLGEKVRYHGRVLDKAKEAVLENSHFLLLPTEYVNEGQPLSIIEAQAHGSVVVATDYRAIPDMVIDGVTGILVPPKDAWAIARAVRNLIDDPPRYEEVSRRAREHWAAYFTLEDHVSTLTTIILGDCSLRECSWPVDDLSQSAKTALYFSQIASGWSSRYSSGSAFGKRLEWCIQPIVQNLSKGSVILDFGCGTGDIAAALDRSGFRVKAVDCAETMIEEARAKLCGTTVALELVAPAPWVRLPFNDADVDAFVASSVMEYVEDPRGQLREIARAVKIGGTGVITVPNLQTPIRRLEQLAQCVWSIIPFKKRLTKFSTKIGSYCSYLELSVNRVSIEDWSEVLQDSGFFVEEISGRNRSLARITVKRVLAVVKNSQEPGLGRNAVALSTDACGRSYKI